MVNIHCWKNFLSRGYSLLGNSFFLVTLIIIFYWIFYECNYHFCLKLYYLKVFAFTMCSQGYHISGWRGTLWRTAIVMFAIGPAAVCDDSRTTTACGASIRYAIYDYVDGRGHTHTHAHTHTRTHTHTSTHTHTHTHIVNRIINFLQVVKINGHFTFSIWTSL